MAATAAASTLKKLTTSQFHEVLTELTGQLQSLILPQEAQSILTTIAEINAEERQQKRSCFSMVPHVYWELCRQHEVGHIASDLYLYLNAHTQREKENLVQISLRKLAKVFHIARETVDACLDQFQTLGWLRVERGTRGKTKTVKIYVTNAIWEANDPQKRERAQQKAALKSGLYTSPSSPLPPSAPSLASLSTLSNEVSSSSPSSFLPSHGPSNSPGGLASSPESGPASSPQNKKDLNQESLNQEKDQIRSGSSLQTSTEKPGEERTQRYLALAHQHLTSLENHYTNPRRRAEALAQEQQAADTLAHDPLLAQEDDETLVWLLQHIQSEKCRWYRRFCKDYPDVPIQLKHLLMPGFLDECLKEYKKVRHQLEHDRYMESLSQHSIEAWEQRHGQSQDPQETQAETSVVSDVTEPTENEPDGDVNGQPETREEREENPYGEIEGIRPLLAVPFLRAVRENNPEWEPRLYWAAPGSQVIDVVVGEDRFYCTCWQDYNILRSRYDLPELPQPERMAPRREERVSDWKRADRLQHNRDYLAKCSALKAQQGGY